MIAEASPLTPTVATRIVVRETLVSMAINAAISLGFFFAVFGLTASIASRAFGVDFLPQAFMVALMGSLVPGLLVRRHGKDKIGTIVKRAVVLAVLALVVAGGGAWMFFAARGGSVAPTTGLIIKAAFGTMLAAMVTPIAVRQALKKGTRA